MSHGPTVIEFSLFQRILVVAIRDAANKRRLALTGPSSPAGARAWYHHPVGHGSGLMLAWHGRAPAVPGHLPSGRDAWARGGGTSCPTGALCEDHDPDVLPRTQPFGMARSRSSEPGGKRQVGLRTRCVLDVDPRPASRARSRRARRCRPAGGGCPGARQDNHPLADSPASDRRSETAPHAWDDAVAESPFSSVRKERSEKPIHKNRSSR